VEADEPCYSPSLSADGRYVVFSSPAATLVAGDTNGVSDIFLVDRDPDQNALFDTLPDTTRISVGPGGAQADAGSYDPQISGDGESVIFVSTATNLVSGDTNGQADIFVWRRATNDVIRVSVSDAGAQADAPCANPSISHDGTMVAFDSAATTLSSEDVLGFTDVFVRDLTAGTTTRASSDADGGESNGDSVGPALSGDGLYVAFYTSASDLLGVDSNSKFDTVIRGPLR
jgi:Tol biopolymer transport system component